MFTRQGIVNFLEVSAQLGIIATAAALLMIGGEFDLSVGSMIGFAGVVIGVPAVTSAGWPLWLAHRCSPSRSPSLVGYLNGLLVVRTGLPSFIVTLAALFILRGLTLGVTRADHRPHADLRASRSGDEHDWLVASSSPARSSSGCFRWLAADRLDRRRAPTALPFVPGHPDVDRLVDRPDRGRHLGAAAHPLRQLDLRRRRRPDRGAQRRRAGRPGEDHPVHRAPPAPRRCSPRSRCWSAGSADTLRGTQKEFEAIIAAVIGGMLLTGGYGSAIGAAFGALIFGIVQMGIFYTGIDTDWFKVFLGVDDADRGAVQQLHPRARSTEAR